MAFMNPLPDCSIPKNSDENSTPTGLLAPPSTPRRFHRNPGSHHADLHIARIAGVERQPGQPGQPAG